ncbi:hypothetical protein MTR67_006905 [Solanum verrucosum]|uniref:Uncharacterized protein n=1 Tax=Solanum verrucosum TaxID=315347 RepID=A0AAF0Q117_SOLVR|nr:hypothetical protein MTR67_006905 [Solanum verrucosum]
MVKDSSSQGQDLTIFTQVLWISCSKRPNVCGPSWKVNELSLMYLESVDLMVVALSCAMYFESVGLMLVALSSTVMLMKRNYSMGMEEKYRMDMVSKELRDEDLLSPHSFEDETRYVPFMSFIITFQDKATQTDLDNENAIEKIFNAMTLLCTKVDSLDKDIQQMKGQQHDNKYAKLSRSEDLKTPELEAYKAKEQGKDTTEQKDTNKPKEWRRTSLAIAKTTRRFAEWLLSLPNFTVHHV